MTKIPLSAIHGSEANVHEQVCDYLRLQYPHVLFHTDFAAGVKMTMGQAVKNKRLQSGRAWPDLFIAEPRKVYTSLHLDSAVHYHGLFIEIKKEGTKIYLKDGKTLVANKHIKEQFETLEKLRERGYKAEFGIGFEHTKNIIDEYLNGNI